MKIFRIIARLNVGGPARHCIWLTKELQDNEFQSQLIAGTVPDGEENMEYFAAENGVSPVFIKEMSRELSPRDVISIFKVYRALRRERPDIVHTHTAKAGTVGRIAAFFYRWVTLGTLIGRPRPLKTVHTFHGHVFHSYYGKLKTGVFLTIERLLARFATDKIVVISKQQMAEINGDFKVGRAGQFSVIPLGIDVKPFAAESGRESFRAEIGADENDIVIGFVGRLTEIKNLSHYLNVAAMYNELSSASQPSLKFVVVGDGHLRRSLENEARGLGLSRLVSFVGNQTDTASVYAAIDVVALTSLNEGTPLSLIEAMAASRPFISTAVGGVVDLLGKTIESGEFLVCEHGIGVSGSSPEAYLKGLLCLATNSQMRQDMGRSGRDFVYKNYSKDRLVSDIKDLYRSLLSA